MYDTKELIDAAMSKLKKDVTDGPGPKRASDRVQLMLHLLTLDQRLREYEKTPEETGEDVCPGYPEVFDTFEEALAHSLVHGVAVHRIDPSDEDDVDALFSSVRKFMGVDPASGPDETACWGEDCSCRFDDDEDMTSADIARDVLEFGLVGHTDMPYAEVVQTLDILSRFATGEDITKAEGRFTIVPGVTLVVTPGEFEDEDEEDDGVTPGWYSRLSDLPDTEETVAAMSERILDEITHEYRAICDHPTPKKPYAAYVPMPVFAHMKANTGAASRLQAGSRLQPPQLVDSLKTVGSVYDTYTTLVIRPSRDVHADFYFVYHE